MRRLRRRTTLSASILVITFLGASALGAGCGDDPEAADQAGHGSTTGTGTGGGGGQGGGGAACTTPQVDATRGSAIAISPDDSVLVVANRDVGTVSVLRVDYTDGAPKISKTAEIEVGGEPWQVAIDGCGATAYVVLRKDRKLVEITGLGGEPAKGREA